MRIGICDDERFQREYLSKLCMECADKLKIDCDIVEFSTGEEVLNYQGEMLTLLLLGTSAWIDAMLLFGP